jgi:beta-galactosidase
MNDLSFVLRCSALSCLLLTASRLTGIARAESLSSTSRVTIPFDAEWRFLKSDARGAEKPEFDDSSWRALDVPHDWSIEGPFDQKNKTGSAGGFLPAGIGWYRKHFTLPPSYAQRRVFIEFDGVMANSTVWINGHYLGFRPYGYVSFRYELTGHLQFSADRANLLTVRVDNSAQPASRWYAGAGIYRHVRLVITNPVYLGYHATFITTSKIAPGAATVHVQTKVVNDSGNPQKVVVSTTIKSLLSSALDEGNTYCGESSEVAVPAGKSLDISYDIGVSEAPKLWNLEHPNLYSAQVKIHSSGRIVDEERLTFGIREFHFDPDTGFWLNGKNFKLKGVCLHHDAGGLGTAVPLGAWERRLKLLKETGCNAIRTSHNPVAPEFLDLCDRMGFLVMDEMFDCWTVGKNPYDYHLYFDSWSQTDTRDTVRRDRNHPSIILYSAGNEIHDTPKADLAKKILGFLIDVFHAEDPTRPVTQALFRPNASHDYQNGLADMLDVVGQNYREREILSAHRDKPSRKIVGTENQHAREVWLALRDNAPYAGQFLWTGIDYLGEAPGWPEISRPTGLFDRTGVAYPRAFERQSWWSDKPMVYITRRVGAAEPTSIDPGYEKFPAPREFRQVLFSDWTPENLEAHEENVEVYSNCEQVELFLNEKSLGSQALPDDASPRMWKVAFQEGELKTVGKNKGEIVATHQLRTAGKPAKIVIVTDKGTLKNEWDDVAYLNASVVDENGVLVPNANHLITFKVSGSGAIAAVDNGDNSGHEPFQASERHAYQGRCIAILKAKAPSGKITVEASAPGLKSGSVSLEAEPARPTDK